MDLANYTSGYFSRNVSGFSRSAQEIGLQFRDDGPWLTAELRRKNGDYYDLQGINLDLHITNNNGQLEWIVSDPTICRDGIGVILTSLHSLKIKFGE